MSRPELILLFICGLGIGWSIGVCMILGSWGRYEKNRREELGLW